MYKRIILKLSGETLSGDSCAFYASRVNAVADMLIRLKNRVGDLGVVLGGGNIWRGRFTKDMNPVNADQMGMLATVINAVCVCDAITRLGGRARVFSAQEMNRFANLYTRDSVLESFARGEIALLAGGSGNPFFTTDTAAALRAAELNADCVFKGTTVDGVYDCDPRDNPNAKLLRDVSYSEAVDMRLKVMDTTAFIICQERNVNEIRVFSMDDLENIIKVADGLDIGTRVHA